MQQEEPYGLVWFRNDLRVTDQSALQAARARHDRILGVYCFDPRHFEQTSYGFRKTEKYRAKFLSECVAELQDALFNLNISLIVNIGKPEDIIPGLTTEYAIAGVYCQKEWTQEERHVLEQVKASMPEQIPFHEYYDQFLFHPEDCPIAIPEIPEVFTTFRKSCEKYTAVRAEVGKPQQCVPENLLHETTDIPTLEDLGFESFEIDTRSAFPFKGGEIQATNRLIEYVFTTMKLGCYKKTRNGLQGTNYSSKFSPWLALGCISPRQIYWAVKRFEKEHYKNQSTYWMVFELIWRDYFKYISLKHGNRIFQLGGILNKSYDWQSSMATFKKWIEGATSEPFVNANMIELKSTGWMSNRGRQNVASYLAKEMKVDWRMGAAYFESMLIDYDVHSNYGNWMYVAGVGNDPRDRKFNVRLQAKRYDPAGTHQNQWLQKSLF